MDDKTAKTYIQQIQADAERLTLKRLKDDQEEAVRLEAVRLEADAKADPNNDNKKKA